MTIQCECQNIQHVGRCTEQVKWTCNECGAYLCGACANKHHAHQTWTAYSYTPPTNTPPTTPRQTPGAADVVGQRTIVAAGPYAGWHGVVIEEGSEDGWVLVRFDGGAGDIEVPLNICGVEYQ